MQQPTPTKAAPTGNFRSWTWREIQTAAEMYQQLVTDIYGDGEGPYGLKAKVCRQIAERLDRPVAQVRGRLANCGASFKDARHGATPGNVLSDQRAREAALQQRGLMAVFFGDPPVGYSALDRRAGPQ